MKVGGYSDYAKQIKISKVKLPQSLWPNNPYKFNDQQGG